MRTRYMPVRTLATLPCLTATPLAPDDVGEGIPIDPATMSFARDGVLCGASVGFIAGDCHTYPPVIWHRDGSAGFSSLANMGVAVFLHPSLTGTETARLLRLLADQAERANLAQLPVSGIAPCPPDPEAAESLLARALLLAEGCHPTAPMRLPRPPDGFEYNHKGKLRPAQPLDADEDLDECECDDEEVCDAAAE